MINLEQLLAWMAERCVVDDRIKQVCHRTAGFSWYKRNDIIKNIHDPPYFIMWLQKGTVCWQQERQGRMETIFLCNAPCILHCRPPDSGSDSCRLLAMRYCELICISRENYQSLLIEFSEIQQLAIIVKSELNAISNQREAFANPDSYTERMRSLERSFPGMIRNLDSTIMASYLRIPKWTYKRLRLRLSLKGEI